MRLQKLRVVVAVLAWPREPFNALFIIHRSCGISGFMSGTLNSDINIARHNYYYHAHMYNLYTVLHNTLTYITAPAASANFGYISVIIVVIIYVVA